MQCGEAYYVYGRFVQWGILWELMSVHHVGFQSSAERHTMCADASRCDHEGFQSSAERHTKCADAFCTIVAAASSSIAPLVRNGRPGLVSQQLPARILACLHPL